MPTATSLRTVAATRYVTPLREGGSLPGLVEADDDGMYVVKFRAAGQGLKALVAEVIVGELARRLGPLVPELVGVELDPALALAEPDPEIQDLITGSEGLNLGVDFLPAALSYSPGAFDPGPELAADIVWLDALTMNVDRAPRNPNMLIWHERLWLIDHGAALYLHHGGLDPAAHAGRSFPQIREHVLLGCAGAIPGAHARLGPAIEDGTVVADAIALVPEEWLTSAERADYLEFLTLRARDATFVKEAEDARSGS
jgi:hypothetical protein